MNIMEIIFEASEHLTELRSTGTTSYGYFQKSLTLAYFNHCSSNLSLNILNLQVHKKILILSLQLLSYASEEEIRYIVFVY